MLLALFSPSAYAVDNAPMLYSLADIKIVRYSAPALPWNTGEKPAPDTGVTFSVEVRDGATFYKQEGWISLVAPPPLHGVLLAFGAPVLAPIAPAAHYAPLDILMIDKEGTVMQILPDIKLSNLEKDIYPSAPVSAFLLLKGGACKALSIMPGDSVEYALFKKPPPVLSRPKISP